MKQILKLSDIIYRIVQGVAILLLAALVTLFFVQSVLRFGFNRALPWAEELCRYMLFWATFLESGIGISKGVHVGFDLVTSRVKGNVEKALYIASNIIVFVLACRMIIDGRQLVRQTANQFSPSMGFSMSYVYMSVMVGGILLAFFCIVDIIRKVVGE